MTPAFFFYELGCQRRCAPLIYLRRMTQSALSLSAEDRAALRDALASPWQTGELLLKNRDGSPRRFWPHQIEDLSCERSRIVHQDAADVGKTVALVADLVHFLITTSDQHGLVTAPISAQFAEIIKELEWQCDHNEILMAFVKETSRRHGYYSITSHTGSVIDFRPAGRDGASYKSLHVHRVWADEAAGIESHAWHVLVHRLIKGEGRMRAYSYPDGRRDTEYFKATQSSSWMVFHFPMSCRPDWSPKLKQQMIEEHGGSDSPEYQHMVDGVHGIPSHAAFNINNFHACQQRIDGYQIVTMRSDEFGGLEGDAEIVDRVSLLLGGLFRQKPGPMWMGVDPAYTSDPCALTIWHEDGAGVLMRTARVHLEGLTHPVKTRVVAELDRRFSFAGIGLDNGGDGLSIVDDLVQRDEFNDLPNRKHRIRGFYFQGNIAIGTDESGTPITRNIKEHSTRLMNEAMQWRTAIWPKGEIADETGSMEFDIETERQFITQTYTTSGQRIIYSKGFDHIIDADRVAFLVRASITELDALSGVHEISCTPAAVTGRVFT